MPIFGITASSNQTTKLTDFYQIATTTLSSAQSSIDFTSIPQTYTHLQIRGIGRNTVVNTDDNITVRFNSDSGSNYSFHYLVGDGAAAASSGAATQTLIIPFRVPGGSSAANTFGAGVLDILDYSNTNKFKTTRSITGHDQNGSGSVWLFSGNWRSTSAITSISLFYSGNTLAANTTFALYGIKG
jgi:hypothetical protein